MPSTPLRLLQRPLSRFNREVRDGYANRASVPLRRQLAAWRRGFYANHSLMYDFDRFGFDAYVSDLQRATKVEPLNDPVQRNLLNDKLVSFLFLRSIGAPTPEVYGYTNGERTVFLAEQDERGGIERLLETKRKLVLKPRGASGGDRFCVLEQHGDTTSVNGQPGGEVRGCLQGSVVISEFIEQHEYARDVYPRATNALRMPTLRDTDSGEPFVGTAIHRFGTERSKPVDNTRKGGLPARVEVQTGVLGPLAAMPGYYAPGHVRVQWHDVHPDTGVRVKGMKVPYWAEIVNEIRRVMLSMEGLRCVGWDVAVTRDGFTIIEGNNRPDVIMQVFRPFLVEERIRRFFQDNGVVTATT